MSYVPESDIRVKSYELPLLNFDRLHELCVWIGHSCEKLWPVKFFESFRCSISSVSINYFPESNIRAKCYDHSNFSRASVVEFRASRWVMPRIEHPCERLCPLEFLESFRCSISSVFINYVPKSDIHVKTYVNSNFSRASVVQFRTSRWVMPRIGHPCERLWPFEFLESFRCSISSVSIYYVPESNIRVTFNDHSNFLRASVV